MAQTNPRKVCVVILDVPKEILADVISKIVVQHKRGNKVRRLVARLRLIRQKGAGRQLKACACEQEDDEKGRKPLPCPCAVKVIGPSEHAATYVQQSQA